MVTRLPLPPQSPTYADPAFVHDGEPEWAMSMKSTSPLMTTAAPVQVIVRCVPRVFEATRSRLTPWVVLPPQVSVPVTVKSALTVQRSVLTFVPVRVKPAQVHPLTEGVDPAPLPLITIVVPLKSPAVVVIVNPPVPVSVMVAVLAVIVRFDQRIVSVEARAADKVMADEPSVNVLVDEPLLTNEPAVTDLLLVSSVA